MSGDIRKFQVPAVLEGVTTLKDGGLSARFHTNELNKEDKLAVMDHLQQFGWLLFAPQEHDDSDELAEIRKDTGGKTPSQRLRATIYVYYQQSYQKDLTFEQFYQRQMERLINIVKQNLRD
jgi:hypothetical protein